MVGEKFREACLQGYETVREGRRANDAVWSVLGHAPKCPLLFEEGDVVDGRARLVAGGLVVGVLVSRAGRRPRLSSCPRATPCERARLARALGRGWSSLARRKRAGNEKLVDTV